MVNTENFAKRLQKVMEYYEETASSFAEKIGVQRSSISHVLSGRNKPSLEFVLKVLSTYPEVELYWLLNGKGNFPSSTSESVSSQISRESSNKSFMKEKNESDKTIERIVIFYSDGSFQNFDK